MIVKEGILEHLIYSGDFIVQVQNRGTFDFKLYAKHYAADLAYSGVDCFVTVQNSRLGIDSGFDAWLKCNFQGRVGSYSVLNKNTGKHYPVVVTV